MFRVFLPRNRFVEVRIELLALGFDRDDTNAAEYIMYLLVKEPDPLAIVFQALTAVLRTGQTF